MVKQQGLTLIEMLVSLLILTIVMSLSSTAYRYYVVGFNDNGDKIYARSAELIRRELVQQQVESAFYYYVKIDPINRSPYFVGTDQSISWIVPSSIQRPNYSALAWLGIQNKKLVYCERLMIDKLVNTVPNDPSEICDVFSYEIGEPDVFNIRYFGWQNIHEQFGQASEFSVPVDKPSATWSDSFSSLDRKVLPLFVVVSLAEDKSEEWWFTLKSRDVVSMGIFYDQSKG